MRLFAEVTAKVMIDPSNLVDTQVVIRKVVKDEDDRCVGIFGLGRDGQWLEKPEGEPYPDECFLPVVVYNANEIEFWDGKK